MELRRRKSKPVLRKRKHVVVEWEDPTTSTKWYREKNETKDLACLHCWNSGWIVPSRRGYLCVASCRSSNGECSDIVTVPRRNVISVKSLREVEE